MLNLLIALFLACGGDPSYIVEGTVVEVTSPTEVVIDHAEVKGLMPAMVMPFQAKDPAVFAGLKPGDRVKARLVVSQDGGFLEKLRVEGHGVAPTVAKPDAGAALRPGVALAATTLSLPDGSPLVVGEGAPFPTAITFLYTRCPLPEMCPATVLKLQALQEKVRGKARLVAVTLDPAGDTPEVLTAFAAQVGADPATWTFARAEGPAMDALVRAAALGVTLEEGQILHGTRWLVLGADGKLIERYDDNRLPIERVAEQLLTGGPAAPPGSDGTITPEAG